MRAGPAPAGGRDRNARPPTPIPTSGPESALTAATLGRAMPPEGGTTAMTPQEIAARLPELTGGPHDDDTIIALAQITAEAVRTLNHATFPPGGLSEPATAYTVLGQLAAAAHRLPQLCGQLARWLAGENAAGRLAHTTGGLDDALDDVQVSLDRAARHATQLGETLDQAHQATAWLRLADDGGEDR